MEKICHYDGLDCTLFITSMRMGSLADRGGVIVKRKGNLILSTCLLGRQCQCGSFSLTCHLHPERNGLCTRLIPCYYTSHVNLNAKPETRRPMRHSFLRRPATIGPRQPDLDPPTLIPSHPLVSNQQLPPALFSILDLDPPALIPSHPIRPATPRPPSSPPTSAASRSKPRPQPARSRRTRPTCPESPQTARRCRTLRPGSPAAASAAGSAGCRPGRRRCRAIWAGA